MAWMTGLLLLFPVAATAKNLGLFIGISRYHDVRGVPTLRFADGDADALKQEWGWNFNPADNVKVLVNEKATAAAVREELTQALMVRPGATDTVYIFISARGIATPDLGADGYLLAFDSIRDRAYDTAVSVRRLGEMIQLSRARQVFLFADVCRDPTELTVANLINYKLDLLKKLKAQAQFSFILASRPEQLSREDVGYRRGIFNHYLAEALAEKKAGRNGTVNLQELFDYLKTRMKVQEPWRFGNAPPQLTVQPVASRWRRFPQLLASLSGPVEGLLSEMEPQQSADADLATALDLENRAQQTLLRYGAGDQFPEDDRPDANEFHQAADLFDQAYRIRSLLAQPADAAVLGSLRERSLACKAQQLLLEKDYSDAISALPGSKDHWIAMSYNVAGIIDLEQSNFANALDNFKHAIDLSPDWAYARHNLALTYGELGDYRAAEQEYRESIRRTPYHPYLHYNLGVLMQRVNRTRDAERAYVDALAWFTRQIRRHRKRARDWEEAGVPEEAKRAAHFADVLELNRAQALNTLGSLRQAAHKLRAAADYYGAGLKANPNLNAARYNLGAVDVDLGNVDEGIGLLEAAVTADAGLMPAWAKLAEAYRRKAELEPSENTARAELEKAAAAYAKLPVSPSSQVGLNETQADLARLSKNAPAACDAYQRAQHDATDPGTRKRLRRRIGAVCKPDR
jgi:tetratricopeptide (TPR) repeat protein